MAADRALAGRSALVTGASRGIGFACARALAAAGARVAMLARDRAALADAVKRVGDGAHAVPCDLGDPERVERAIDDVRRALDGAPDVIVNGAGAFLLAPAEETSVAEFDRLLVVNLTAPFAIVHAFLPEMRRRGRGHLVTIGSLADRRAMPGNAAYASGKFGLRALHEVLREELRGSGVRATLVSPAHVDTSIWEGVGDAAPPASAMIAPDAVAEAVLYAVTAPPEVNVDELRLSRA